MLSFLLGFYLFSGLAIYVYSVIKTYEWTGYWNFRITEDEVGIVKYPKWLLFWLYWIVKTVRRG